MVFSSVLGFLLIVASVGANIPEECVQNPSLSMCQPRRAFYEDGLGEMIIDCIDRFGSAGSCHFCALDDKSPECAGVESLGMATWECLLDRKWEACEACALEIPERWCDLFPKQSYWRIRGVALEQCIFDERSKTACDFCRHNRSDVKCKNVGKQFGNLTISCVLDRNSEACDTCNDGISRTECAWFPATHIEDVTGKTLKACMESPKNKAACEFCTSNFYNRRCWSPHALGYIATICVLRGDEDACDTCSIGPSAECEGFPDSRKRNVTGKKLKECIKSPRNKKACEFCKNNRSDARCERPSNIGKLTVECLLNKKSKACDSCKKGTHKPECAGFPTPSTKRYGKIMKMCHDDKDHDACSYCLTRQNEPECRISFVGLAKTEHLVSNADIIAPEDTFVGFDNMQSRIGYS